MISPEPVRFEAWNGNDWTRLPFRCSSTVFSLITSFTFAPLPVIRVCTWFSICPSLLSRPEVHCSPNMPSRMPVPLDGSRPSQKTRIRIDEKFVHCASKVISSPAMTDGWPIDVSGFIFSSLSVWTTLSSVPFKMRQPSRKPFTACGVATPNWIALRLRGREASSPP